MGKVTTLYARDLQFKPPVVTGICDQNKSQKQHHCSLKLGSRLKYLNIRKKRRPFQDLKQVSKVILFTVNELKEAENYLFKKATLDIKKFVKPSQYEKISPEANGILCYSDRILATDRISSPHRHSPLANSIHNKWDPLVFKCYKAHRCWNNMEICFKSLLFKSTSKSIVKDAATYAKE